MQNERIKIVEGDLDYTASYPPEFLARTDHLMENGEEVEAFRLLDEFDQRGVELLFELETLEDIGDLNDLLAQPSYTSNNGILF